MPISSRETLHSAIHALLADDSPTLTILGVSGPGGIGKTWGIQSALSDFNLLHHGILQIAIDGSDESTLQSPIEFACRYLTPAQLPEPGRYQEDHFPQTRKVLKCFRSVCEEAASDEELRRLVAEGHEWVKGLLEFGAWLNDAVPWTRKKVDFKVLDGGREQIFQKVAEILERYWQSRSFWPWNQGENDVKRDLLGTLGEAIAIDFKAMVKGFTPIDAQKYTRFASARIDGNIRLLIFLDDFERTQEALGDLLLGNLLGRLRDYQLPIRMIIAGRDSLIAADGRFKQYLASNLVGQYDLDILPEVEAIRILQTAGYSGAEAATIYQETGGYPYLIGHYLDQGREGATSALGAKLLYERTTKWMRPEQRRWLKIVLNLEEVNLATLKNGGVAPDEAEAIQEWFENEPSLRDPRASVFKVNPMLATHINRYLRLHNG